MSVYDSGSAGVTASFNFDGLTNDWFYSYRDSGGNIDYGVTMFGPDYTTKGTPVYLTNNRIPKSDGGHHLNDSNISDSGTVVTINSNSTITGSLTVNQVASNVSTSINTNRGTKTSPAYSFIGDNDTGVFSDAANQVALTAGGRTGLNVTDTQVLLDTNSTTAFSHIVMSNGSGYTNLSQVPTSSISLQGPSGPQGTTGTTGATGPTGAQGATGTQGTTGTTGAQGAHEDQARPREGRACCQD